VDRVPRASPELGSCKGALAAAFPPHPVLLAHIYRAPVQATVWLATTRAWRGLCAATNGAGVGCVLGVLGVLALGLLLLRAGQLACRAYGLAARGLGCVHASVAAVVVRRRKTAARAVAFSEDGGRTAVHETYELDDEEMAYAGDARPGLADGAGSSGSSDDGELEASGTDDGAASSEDAEHGGGSAAGDGAGQGCEWCGRGW
jgi:hypothetical protein